MICEQVYAIDIRRIAKPHRGNVFNPILRRWETLNIVETKTGFGARGWYECPCCKRRVAILYANPHFACRTCHGLHYAIERESIRDRAIRTAIKHRRNFGLRSGGVIAPFPSKPHLMRWHTYFKARETDRSNLEKIAKCF